jgi:hypothetical protein
MKKDDPTITALRDARHRISESVGHDPRKLVAYYRKLQERHRDRLVTPAKGTLEGDSEGAA